MIKINIALDDYEVDLDALMLDLEKSINYWMHHKAASDRVRRLLCLKSKLRIAILEAK